MQLFFLFFLLTAVHGCIPTISPDDDDIMAQLEEMRTTMAMLETTATCGAACQPTSTLGTTVPTTSSTSTEPATSTTTTSSSTTTTTTTTSTTTTTTTLACFGSDMLFQGSCYRIVTMAGTQDFPNSKTQCMMLNGGQLCTITSMTENDHVADLVITACSIGCTVHMGGERASMTDEYIWPDGVPFSATWTNWASGNPTMSPAPTYLCTQFHSDDRQWRSQPCSGGSYPCCEYPPMTMG